MTGRASGQHSDLVEMPPRRQLRASMAWLLGKCRSELQNSSPRRFAGNPDRAQRADLRRREADRERRIQPDLRQVFDCLARSSHTRRRNRQKRNRPGGRSSFAALRAQSIPSRFYCCSGAHANRHLLLSRSRRNICCEPWQTMDAPHAVSDAEDEPWRKATYRAWTILRRFLSGGRNWIRATIQRRALKSSREAQSS